MFVLQEVVIPTGDGECRYGVREVVRAPSLAALAEWLAEELVIREVIDKHKAAKQEYATDDLVLVTVDPPPADVPADGVNDDDGGDDSDLEPTTLEPTGPDAEPILWEPK